MPKKAEKPSKKYEDMLECWQRIDDEIKKRKITLTELARNVGIIQQTLNKQVQNDTLPNIKEAYDICNYLGISMEYFIDGKDRNMSKISSISIQIAYAAENLNDEGKKVALNIVEGLTKSFPLDSSVLSNLPTA